MSDKKKKAKKVIRFLHFSDLINFEDDEEIIMRYLDTYFKKSEYKYTHVDIPTFLDQDAGKFDVLFFDWGGMSIGNSMLEHYCRYIIEQAQNKPDVYYVMTSFMTSLAMKDAMEYFEERDGTKSHNIWLDDLDKYFDKYAEILKK